MEFNGLILWFERQKIRFCPEQIKHSDFTSIFACNHKKFDVNVLKHEIILLVIKTVNIFL